MAMKLTGMDEALASIGRIKDVVSKEANSPLQRIVANIGIQIISQLKQSGRDSGLDQNSILLQSIAPTIVANGNKIRITINANDYWDFVNSGVNGILRSHGAPYSFKTPFPNRSMAKSLQQGMSFKGISLPPGFKDFESYSYAAATKIKKEGIRPNHFVDKVLTPEFIEEISLFLARELGKEVILTINNT